MQIYNLPNKYKLIWQQCLSLLKKGRVGDAEHAKEIINFILNYKGQVKFDKDILIPVAMMHDIGHSAVLPEHFKYITGPQKIMNGKLVHMLVGAKIANDILANNKYNKQKSREIVEIISIHDAHQLKEVNIKKFYNTKNKKVFHDIDSLDRYTEKRLDNVSAIYKDRVKLIKLLESLLDSFFYKEFRVIAEKALEYLK